MVMEAVVPSRRRAEIDGGGLPQSPAGARARAVGARVERAGGPGQVGSGARIHREEYRFRWVEAALAPTGHARRARADIRASLPRWPEVSFFIRQFPYRPGRSGWLEWCSPRRGPRAILQGLDRAFASMQGFMAAAASWRRCSRCNLGLRPENGCRGAMSAGAAGRWVEEAWRRARARAQKRFLAEIGPGALSPPGRTR